MLSKRRGQLRQVRLHGHRVQLRATSCSLMHGQHKHKLGACCCCPDADDEGSALTSLALHRRHPPPPR